MWAEEGDSPEQEDTTETETEVTTEIKENHGVNLQELKVNENSPRADEQEPAELSAVYDIPVQVSAVLGKATMPVNQLLKLGRGAVVELDRRIGEAIDVYVNNRLVARGEVVVVEDRLGITMTEIIKTEG